MSVSRPATNEVAIFNEISLDKIIKELVSKHHKRPLAFADYDFAKQILKIAHLNILRKDNFCIDLTTSGLQNNPQQMIPLENWTKDQCRAFGKLYAAFSNQAALHLQQKQETKTATSNDVQLLWLKLPKQNNENRKKVNEIKKYLENNGYEDNTGNENWLSLQRFINTKKPNPMVRYTRSVQSVSVVIVTDTEKVLLLQRAGASGRAGTYGTLTGKMELNESPADAAIREVHEEINCLLSDKITHFLGTAYTANLCQDLTRKGQQISFADDQSFLYAIVVPEIELRNSIKLTDDENSQWRLFTCHELKAYFATCHKSAIHGTNIDPSEQHVALAKSLLALDCAKNNFKSLKVNKFTFPYTNSHGFFVKPTVTDDKPDIAPLILNVSNNKL
jgi:8-oxo-dGTP pyrophosphatase MutT (NUDIX family)